MATCVGFVNNKSFQLFIWWQESQSQLNTIKTKIWTSHECLEETISVILQVEVQQEYDNICTLGVCIFLSLNHDRLSLSHPQLQHILQINIRYKDFVIDYTVKMFQLRVEATGNIDNERFIQQKYIKSYKTAFTKIHISFI